MHTSSEQGLQHSLDRFEAACNQAGKKSKIVYAASQRQYTAAGGEVKVPWGSIHKCRKADKGTS